MDVDFMMMGGAVVVAVVVVVAVAASRIGVVARNQIVVLERMGTITRSVSNTMYVLRFLEAPRAFYWSWDGRSPSRRTVLPLTEQVLDPPSLSVRAQSYPCEVDVLVRYRIVDPLKAAEATDDVLRAAMVNIQSKLRQVASQKSWAELDRGRNVLASELLDGLNENDRYGIVFTEVIIEGITVSPDVQEGFKVDAQLEADMRQTNKRRQLELFREETKTAILQAELERDKLRAANEAARLRTLADAGVDTSAYLLASAYNNLANAIAQGGVSTLVLGAPPPGFPFTGGPASSLAASSPPPSSH